MFNPKKPRVLVAFGGRSSERKISIASGIEVISALEKNGYQGTAWDTGTGALLQAPELEKVEQNPDRLPPAINFPLIDIKRHFSLVFIALHGRFGEDGALQGLLEEFKVKYTGSEPLGCALAMNKKFTKIILEASNLPTLKHRLATNASDKVKTGFPAVVKPNDQGSSVGVSICQNEAELKMGLSLALRHSREALVEPYIKGKELTVGVLEDKNGQPRTLPVIEIIPKTKFFDYRAKYDGTTEEIVPARISEKLASEARRVAEQTHRALGCRHFSRVDMVADQTGRIFILELNTVPGLTKESLFPKAARAAGYDFPALVDHLVKIALGKSDGKQEISPKH